MPIETNTKNIVVVLYLGLLTVNFFLQMTIWVMLIQGSITQNHNLKVEAELSFDHTRGGTHGFLH